MNSLFEFPVVSLEVSTPDSEQVMGYVARVSNPENQSNPNYQGLLSYCVKNKHWSVFEHASMTLEITTTLDIATQILRHRSFCFQQLSRRYAGENEAPVRMAIPQLREPHPKNRQASLDTLDPVIQKHFAEKIDTFYAEAEELYVAMLAHGIAKECARCVLPQGTVTTLYMTGNCRSWIHYIALRSGNGTQVEHQKVALAAKEIFGIVFPTVKKVMDELEWKI
jgi:thymidylate synthase (FAD)